MPLLVVKGKPRKWFIKYIRLCVDLSDMDNNNCQIFMSITTSSTAPLSSANSLHKCEHQLMFCLFIFFLKLREISHERKPIYTKFTPNSKIYLCQLDCVTFLTIDLFTTSSSPDLSSIIVQIDNHQIKKLELFPPLLKHPESHK